MNSATPMISTTGLTKIYQRGSEIVRALDNVTTAIPVGDFVAVTGPSGAGKTTFLNLIGCMDAPTSGTLQINGRSVETFSERERTRLRREEIGFVFQHFGLIPTLTVEENILLPSLFGGRAGTAAPDELLQRVGLAHRRRHKPAELSGGEMQRVAIARALLHKPRLLLADEPTGNLDSVTGETIIDLFRQLNAEGLTIVTVTHNAALMAAAKRQLPFCDGKTGELNRSKQR